LPQNVKGRPIFVTYHDLEGSVRLWTRR
jgi:hypothetical protein